MLCFTETHSVQLEGEDRVIINKCIEENLRNTKRISPDRQGLSVSEEVMYIGRDGEFYDELTGHWLDPELVKQARKEEMEEYAKFLGMDLQ